MKKDKLTKILIASPPDRGGVVAEVYFGNNQLAELSVHGHDVTCEIYPCNQGRPWRVDIDELQEALSRAKQKLISDLGG
jgi:hypothetical protein